MMEKMATIDRKQHWGNIYRTKDLKGVSWFQQTPETSLAFFKQYNVPVTAKVIDIGGGDSSLVDHLLDLGYQDISVLDISAEAIDKVKKRLGDRAKKVKWIVADAAVFRPIETYDFWHDRAAFHFLTSEQEISAYVQTAFASINPTGVLVIGTFSEHGPKKCSGIDIKQYSEKSMSNRLNPYFEKIACRLVDHSTPSGSVQNFVFCSFRRVERLMNNPG